MLSLFQSPGRSGIFAALVAAAMVSGAAIAQPANNNCQSAQPILSVPSTINGTTVGATSQVEASSCSGTADDSIDVWYTFTNGGSTTTYTISTNGTPDTNGNFGDTSLEIYGGTCAGGILACDDDSGSGLASRIVITLPPGQTIKIRVAFLSNCDPPCDFQGTVTGPFVLNIAVGSPQAPANDSCANAAVIASASSTTMGTNELATGEDITPCAANDQIDVWFSFVPVTSGQYIIDTLGSIGNGDTSLAIFAGCPAESPALVQPNWQPNLLACNDDIDIAGGEYLSMVKANLAAGTAYKIRVSGFDNTSGDFFVNVSAPLPALPAIPDTCATAQIVTSSFAGNVYTGGARPDAPPGSCNTGTAIADGVLDNAIWYRLVPAVSGLLGGSINGLIGDVVPDSMLLLLSGTCGALTEVACIDDPEPYNLALLPPLVAGTNYYLVIGDLGGLDAGGDISISITLPGSGPGNGACCRGSICTLVASAVCTGTNTAFIGPGTVCNAPGNNTTPCCKADFNHAGGLTVQDIFDFLSAYFGGDLAADFNGGGGITVQDIFDFLAAYFAGC